MDFLPARSSRVLYRYSSCPGAFVGACSFGPLELDLRPFHTTFFFFWISYFVEIWLSPSKFVRILTFGCGHRMLNHPHRVEMLRQVSPLYNHLYSPPSQGPHNLHWTFGPAHVGFLFQLLRQVLLIRPLSLVPRAYQDTPRQPQKQGPRITMSSVFIIFFSFNWTSLRFEN